MSTLTRSSGIRLFAASVAFATLFVVLPAASAPALAGAPPDGAPFPLRDAVVQAGGHGPNPRAVQARDTHATRAKPGTFAPPPARTGASLAVILFTLPDSGSLKVTAEQERQLYFGSEGSVASFYQEASGGSFSLTGAVFGPYAIDVDDSSCTASDWAAAANDAAQAGGVDLSAFDHQAYVFPRMDVCPWSGLASVGEAASFINNPALGDAGLYHAAHEFGHSLGASHAHSETCTADGKRASIAPAGDCSSDEYGDPYSVMGSGIVRLPSGWERVEMGLLPADATQIVGSPGTQTVRVAAIDTPSSSPRLVLVQRTDGTLLSIEYHQSSGAFDRYAGKDPAINGVMIRIVNADGSTSLLDANPQTATFSDAPLASDKSLADPDGGISVSVIGVGRRAATIHVTVVDRSEANPDTTAPLPPTGLEVRDAKNGGMSLTWQPALDNVGVVGYRLLRNGTAVATVDGTDFLDIAHADRTADYVIQSVDAAGNVSAQERVRVADTTPPTSPGRVTLHRPGDRTINLSWSPATDAGGVQVYLVRLDQRHTIRVHGTSAQLHFVAHRHHVVRVWAVDRSGNVSHARTLGFRG